MKPIDPPNPISPHISNMMRLVDQTLREHKMLDQVSTVLVGVSGGPDSVALLHVLVELAVKYHLSLAVAHLNHSLRPRAARREAARVESIASRLDLPFFTETQDVDDYRLRHRLSPEEAARQVRYNFLVNTARRHGYQRIAVGHQADDNAELVMMYLMRGSGSLGLAGIPPVRDNLIIRPLIRVSRQQIMNYLSAANLSYCSDQSNLDNTLTRNRIRNELLPQLRRDYNPGIVQTLNRLAEIMRSEQDWKSTLIVPVYQRVCIRSEPGFIALSRGQLQSEHVAVRRLILRKAIANVKGDLRRMSFGHVQDAIDLIASGSKYGSIDLPDRTRLFIDGHSVCIKKEKDSLRQLSVKDPSRPSNRYHYLIGDPQGDCLEFLADEAGIRLKLQPVRPEKLTNIRNAGQWVAFFDKDALKFPLVLRNFQPGDRFTPLGMKGRQKIKKFFINQKVPREQRAECPILISDENVIWIVGHRTSEHAKLQRSTGCVLKITCDLLQR